MGVYKKFNFLKFFLSSEKSLKIFKVEWAFIKLENQLKTLYKFKGIRGNL